MQRLFILFAFLCFSTWAQAARILDISVTTNNENEVTTSQIVNVEILVERNDPTFRLRLRGFEITGEDREKMRTAYSTFAVIEAPRPQGDKPYSTIKKSFTVPFNVVELSRGNAVQLGYVASLVTTNLDKPETFSEMASQIQIVSVGETRKVQPEPPVAPPVPAAVQATVITAEGTAKPTEEVVMAFPSKEPSESVSLKEQEKRLAEQAKKRPETLAGPRKDVQQALAKPDENLVYFATNRKFVPLRGQFKYRFLSEVLDKGVRGLSWGAASVTLPTREQEQSWWSSARATLLNTYFYGEKKTLEEISNSTSKDVFLFIHGYCNTFEDVILQAGRMKRDLAFKGNVMAFSWPSAGSTLSYGADEAHAENVDSLEAFAYVLSKVVSRAKSQGGRVYLLSHSMGNRFMVFGLRKLYLDMGTELTNEIKEKRTIAVAAFAAPDVDINTFSNVIPNVAAMSQIVSFYYSTKDRALGMSNGLHPMNRAGLSPLFNDGMATINTDQVNGWFSVGHSYYSSSDRAILDLYLQFQFLKLPPQRLPPLVEDTPAAERKLLFKHWFLTAK